MQDSPQVNPKRHTALVVICHATVRNSVHKATEAQSTIHTKNTVYPHATTHIKSRCVHASTLQPNKQLHKVNKPHDNNHLTHTNTVATILHSTYNSYRCKQINNHTCNPKNQYTIHSSSTTKTINHEITRQLNTMLATP
eukprot:gene2670-1668_t